MVAAGVALATAFLYVMEWGVKMSTQHLENHNHARGLILLIETLAHATTGVVFWLVCTTLHTLDLKSLPQVIETMCYAAFAAIIVDIDHFIAAGSLSVKVGPCVIDMLFL